MTQRNIHRGRYVVLVAMLLLHSQPLAASWEGQEDSIAGSSHGRIVDMGSPLGMWRLSDNPEMALGGIGSGPETEFTRPWSVHTVFDTLILVADRQERNIRFFGLDGSLVSTFGRQGDGPGEFQSLEKVTVARGDTVVAYDGALRRLTLFGINGTVFRTRRLEQPEAEFGRPQLVGVDGEGGYYFSFSAAWVGQADEVMRTPVNVYWYNADMTRALRVTSIQGVEWVSVNGRNGVPVSGARPLSRRPMLYERNGLLYAGETGQYSVSVFLKTAQLRVVQRAVGTRPVRRSDIRSFRNERLSMGFTRSEAEARYPVSLFPSTMPLLARVTVDASGFIWVERFRLLANEDHSWDIFDSQGSFVATATTPSGVTITDIQDDYILALETGELDVPMVTRYGLWRDNLK